MRSDEYKVGDVITNSRGRRGEIWSVDGPFIKVIWDSDDEFIYSYRKDEPWLQPLAARNTEGVEDE